MICFSGSHKKDSNPNCILCLSFPHYTNGEAELQGEGLDQEGVSLSGQA